MRVLMLAQFYPPIIGGEETYVHNLSIALVARGYSVAVATTWSPDLPEYEERDGIRIYRLKGIAQRIPGVYSDQGRRHAPPMPDPVMSWALWNIISKEKPEIVHAHNWLVRSFLPIKHLCDAKLIMSLHDYSQVCATKLLIYHDTVCDGPSLFKCIDCAIDHYGLLKGLPTVLTNWTMSAAEKATVNIFIPVSRAVAIYDKLEERGLPYEVIPNFMLDDAAILRDGVDQYISQLPSVPFLLFVGDLRRAKGLHVLIEAYANVLGKQSVPPLVCIGRQCPDTPDRLPPNVHFFYSWPHEAVMHAWNRCAIGIVPSIMPETFGFVALEAMLMGRPVIASRTGGLQDLVVDDETGFLVTPGDVLSLEIAIRTLINDRARQIRMGEAAVKRVRDEFQESVVLPRIERLYNEVLAEREPHFERTTA